MIFEVATHDVFCFCYETAMAMGLVPPVSEVARHISVAFACKIDPDLAV